MKNKLLTISGFIIAAMIALLVYQDHVISKYKNAIEEIDTTAVIIKHDTIDIGTDTTIYKPVIIKETIIRVDTLYDENGDSIPLKKKPRLILIQ